MLTYNPQNKLFIWRGPFEARRLPQEAGFVWSKAGRCWYTASPYIAYLLRKDADRDAAGALRLTDWNVQASSETHPVLDVPAPDGQEYYPFQAAGVEAMTDQMIRGRRHLLLADEQGLGKTIQAIGVANNRRYRKLLVLCPASLRLNWAREIETWHVHNVGADPILNGNSRFSTHGSVITSYNLADRLKNGYRPDLIVIDEAHYCKNWGAQRTKLVLGNGEDWRGFIEMAPTIFLTGTPTPNGRPSELWPILFRCAPDAINYMKYWAFVRRFCTFLDNDYESAVITGARNRKELFVRLRGSGFMTRRLKKDVLRDLPPKRYKMVVFPANGDTRKVLKKESRFNTREIMEHGIPVGSALPEIRREMGVAKAPQCVEYIRDLLEGGVQKVVVFCHHLEVIGILSKGLGDFNPVCIDGSTAPRLRQAHVDAFQEDTAVRVFIGNEAAEEGITLTAASDVVLAEPEWVPGKNDQRVDRLHRIGQTESVLVHILVVEGSLDAIILGSAADKAEDIEHVLDSNTHSKGEVS